MIDGSDAHKKFTQTSIDVICREIGATAMERSDLPDPSASPRQGTVGKVPCFSRFISGDPVT
jgi:hypothetical protein